jgi:hypothetical protein
MLVVMVMAMLMIVLLRSRPVLMGMLMGVVMFQVNIKFYAGNRVFPLPPHMQVVTVQLQLGQFAFQLPGLHAQINQGGQKHVPADAAENVEVKRLHAAARLLIWLAA